MKNRQIRISIVEDDSCALDTLVGYLDKFQKEVNINFTIDKFSCANSFTNNFNSNYDIVFMDIELPDGNGMDLIREIRKIDKNVIVVFITNLAQYAVKGYEVHAYDFIVKPISYYNFYLKLLSVLECVEQKDDKEIWVSNKDGKVKLTISKIKYIEVVQHMLYYHTEDGVVKATGSLNILYDSLKNNGFELCNRCYLVNLKFVKAVRQNTIVVDNEELIISRYKKVEFVKALNDYLAGVE